MITLVGVVFMLRNYSTSSVTSVAYLVKLPLFSITHWVGEMCLGSVPRLVR